METSLYQLGAKGEFSTFSVPTRGQRTKPFRHIEISNMYKDYHMKRVKTLFKQAARHKKSWRCEEYLKKINNIRPTSHKFIKKTGIM
jgi:hypothetical protein